MYNYKIVIRGNDTWYHDRVVKAKSFDEAFKLAKIEVQFQSKLTIEKLEIEGIMKQDE